MAAPNTLLFSEIESYDNTQFRIDLIGLSFTGLNDIIQSFTSQVVTIDGNATALLSIGLAIVVVHETTPASNLNRTIDSFNYNSAANVTNITLNAGTVTSAYTHVTTSDEPEFEVTTKDLTKTYEGEGDEVLNPLKTSTTDWVFYNENSSEATAADYFINRYKYDPETEWILKVQKWNGSSYDLFWIGNIINDNISWNNEDEPSISLKAIDGIGRLKDIHFDQTTDGTITSETTLIDYIQRILSYNNLSQFWGATDIYIEESIEWTNTSSIMDATNGPLENTRTRPESFLDRGKTDVVEAMTVEDSLIGILEYFRARIIHAEGKYKIMQVRNYDTTSYNFRAFYVDSVATPDETGSRTHEKTLGTGAGFDLTALAGGQFTYLPGLLKASTILKRGTSATIQAYGLFSLDVLGGTPEQDVIILRDVIGGAGRRIRIDIVVNSNVTAPPNAFLDIVMDLNDGTNYFRQPLFVDPSWTIINSDRGIGKVDQAVNWQIFSFITPVLPGSGTSTYTATIDYTAQRCTSSESFEIVYSAFSFPVEGEELEPLEISVSNPTDGFSKELDLGGLLIVDLWLNSSYNSLQVKTSTGPDVWGFAGDSWDAGFTVDSFLSDNGIIEAMALQHRPLEIYRGVAVGEYLPFESITYNNKRYVFNGGVFSFITDQWDVEWFEINIVKTGFSVVDQKEIDPRYEGGEQGIPAPQYETDQVNFKELTQLSADVTSSPVTSLNIDATGHTRIKKNDTIYVTHPTTGQVLEEFIVSANVTAIATSISVNSKAITDDLPEGAYVNFKPSEVIESQIVRGVIQNVINLTVTAVNYTVLPSDKYIEVTEGGIIITLLALANASDIYISNTSGGDCIVEGAGAETIMRNLTLLLPTGATGHLLPATADWRLI